MATDDTDQTKITLYALSTCAWCRRAKRFLADHEIEHEVIDVDLLVGDEKASARAAVRAANPRASYPTLVAGDKVVVGYDEERLKEALEL